MTSSRPEPIGVFEVVDSMNLTRLVGLFADHASVTFANAAPLVGRDAIRSGIGQIYNRLQGLSHVLLHVWEPDEHTIVQADVTYHLLDGRHTTCPATTIYRIDAAGLIDEYRVFVDLTPLND